MSYFDRQTRGDPAHARLFEIGEDGKLTQMLDEPGVAISSLAASDDLVAVVLDRPEGPAGAVGFRLSAP